MSTNNTELSTEGVSATMRHFWLPNDYPRTKKIGPLEATQARLYYPLSLSMC